MNDNQIFMTDESPQLVEAIVTGKRDNRTGAMPFLNHSASIHDQDPQQLSEIYELQGSIADAITYLLKLSAMIREASPRDRYAKAAASVKDSFLEKQVREGYDKMHVGSKFPSLEKDGMGWLRDRLGEAITQRRQFLYYCEKHHESLGLGMDDDDGSLSVHLSAQSGLGEVEDDFGGVAHTIASSLPVSDFQPQKKEEEDSRSLYSITSYATSSYEDDNQGWRLRVVNLKAVQEGDLPFECPYCYGIQTTTSQRDWERHVYADLKAYVCLSKDCTLKMFPTRQVWFEHELNEHLSEWQCCYCSTKPFVNIADFEMHMGTDHNGEFKQRQLSALAKTSRRPLSNIPAAACLFCDWPARLRTGDESSVVGDLVPWRRYRKHVGGHLEQLALFALPTETGDMDDAESQKSTDSEVEEPPPLNTEELETDTVQSGPNQPAPRDLRGTTLTTVNLETFASGQDESWHLLSSFDRPPDSLEIGHVIVDPKDPDSVINETCYLPFPAEQIRKTITKDAEFSRFDGFIKESWFFELAEQHSAVPRPEYIANSLNTPEVQAYLENETRTAYLLSSLSLYMVTGIYIAKGPCRFGSRRSDPGIDLSAIGVPISAGASMKRSESGVIGSDTVFAIQLMKISGARFRRGWRGEFSHESAPF